jgi:acetyl-CoA carboxylase carboxyl transferase subunit alpha
MKLNMDKINELEEQIEKLKHLSKDENIDLNEVIQTLEEKRTALYNSLDGWNKTLIARDSGRPKALDYIENLFENFMELKGDRLFMDDRAIIGGPAWFEGEAVFVIAQEKGKTTNDKIERNFGMAGPEGYRKSMRLMKMAEKFNKPLIVLIDTPGAYPGIGAEERGQAIAIAENIMKMSRLKIPIIVIVIGEGGSGGALALAVGDIITMMEYSIYSVISPEGCASILFRDATKAPLAANALKITADHLLNMGIIDKIIKEPLGGAHKNPTEAINNCRTSIKESLCELSKIPIEELLNKRYDKFNKMGKFEIK